MMEFINEPVDVEVHLRRDGTIRPLAFAWRGRRFQIESWGRQSTERRKGHDLFCYLVQTAGMESWELCRDKKTAQWTLTRRWARRRRLA